MTQVTQFSIDMHVHTTAGSLDSYLKPSDLGAAARNRKVDGLLVTEHSSQWSDVRAAEASREQGLSIFAAREWNSPLGHMIILGLAPGSPWEQRNASLRAVAGDGNREATPRGSVWEMRQILDDCGGFMILAHPFRYFGGPDNLLFGDEPKASELDSATLARHPVFELVDEIEVFNGGCTASENNLAKRVAAHLGRPGTGGSDAHSKYEVGRCSTRFARCPESIAELIAILRSGEHVANGPAGTQVRSG